ncbi:MAG: MATE family efflux transporter [Clostridiales Family XIII bacterium]|jgi:putative MATE family efflux protein|nr:MATE family efflux transporter [Clostridiales Family XIII bacterium]
MERLKPPAGEEKLYKKLIRVALPIALQSLIASSLSLVDTLLVGHLGETELATVGLSTQFMFIFWMVLFGFTGGMITYMSQFWGKRDMENIRRVVGITVTVSFSIGLVFFFASLLMPEAILRVFTDIPEVIEMGRPFVRLSSVIFLAWSIVVPLTAALKATQQTRIPLWISIAVFSSNTILCIILIYGHLGAPRLGVMGAATATVISRGLELALYLFVIFGRGNILAGPLRTFFSWTRGLFARVLGNAVPTMLNEMLWSVGVAMYLAAYGRVGVTEVAAVQAGNTIFNLFSLACFSIGDAMLILCGEKLGRGETEAAFELGKRILRIAILIGAAAGGILILTSSLIVRLFGFTELGAHYAVLILVVYGSTLFIKIHNAAILTGALRAGGDTRIGLVIDIGTVWAIGVPLAFAGALWLGLPIYLCVLLVQTEEVVKFFIMRRRFKSKIWVRDLVEDI